METNRQLPTQGPDALKIYWSRLQRFAVVCVGSAIVLGTVLFLALATVRIHEQWAPFVVALVAFSVEVLAFSALIPQLRRAVLGRMVAQRQGPIEGRGTKEPLAGHHGQR